MEDETDTENSEESEQEESEQQESDQEETESGDSNDGSDDKDAQDSAFDHIIEEARSQLEDELEKEPLESEELINKRFQKIFREKYIDTVLWMRRLKEEPIHLKIMDTAKNLRDDNDYDYEESIESSVSMRKHLLNRLVPNFQEEKMDDN